MKVKLRVCGDKDSAYEQAENLGIGHMASTLRHAVSEIIVEVEVDEAAETAEIVSVDGCRLMAKGATAVAASVDHWMTIAEAEAKGYTVNTHCYPPVAYKGPTFAPTEKVCVLTNLEAILLGKT